MCSIGEGDYGDEGAVHSMPITDPEGDSLDTSQTCKKCNIEKVVLRLDFREPQCRSCFLAFVHHKFRASLGASKVLPRDANVLVAVDGSAKSIVLLDMCRFACQLDRFRKLRFNPKILFVDEQPLVTKETTGKVLQILRTYSFETYYVSLGVSGDPVPLTDDHLNVDAYDEGREKFMTTFNTLNSLTSKQDFLQQLKKRIWRSAARSLSCGVVFLPETNSDLAKTLLTNISLGRGASAAHDVSFADDRVEDVKLVRPIRDLSEKEVGHYLRLNDLEYMTTLGLYGDNYAAGASIQNLTSEFVKNLQKNYSSTIATVFRTGDKMAPKMNENGGECRLCHCLLDTIGSETLYATELSSHLSTNKPDFQLTGDIVKDVGEGQLGDLCHACLSISRDTSGAKEFIFAFSEC